MRRLTPRASAPVQVRVRARGLAAALVAALVAAVPVAAVLVAAVPAAGVLVAGSFGSYAFADEPPAPAPAPQPAPPAAQPPAPPAQPPPAPVPEPEKQPLLTFPDDRGIDASGTGVIYRADGTVVYFYTTQYVAPEDLKKSAELMKLPFVDKANPGIGVSFTSFPAQNQLLLAGYPEDVDMALEALKYLDMPTPQVFVEAKVVEITWDSNFEFGLDYLLDRNVAGPNTLFRGVEGILSPPSFLASTLPGGLPFQGTSMALGFVGQNAIDFGAFEAAFRALQENGKAEILSNPSIVCTQGIPAQVTTTEIFNVNQLERADRGNEFYKTNPAKTGVELVVTAKHVGAEYVTIELWPKVDGLAGFASRIGGTLSPIQTHREAKTTVTLRDDETLVLGGLYTNRTVREEAKTPLLSDVPVIGTMFTRQRESKQKSELVFLLKPTIIRKATNPRIIAPPAELKRLERGGDLDDPPPCGPCKPNPDIQDLLFPREAACRDLQERRATAAAREAERASAEETAAAAKAAATPPPPPPPPAPKAPQAPAAATGR
jgi:hypothetical protein